MAKSSYENPFRSKLVHMPADYGVERINSLKDDPYKIVKPLPLEKMEATLDEVTEVSKNSKGLFRELKDKYKIPVTPVDFVIGHKGGSRESTLYSVSEKVAGVILDKKLDDMSDEERKKSTPVFENLFLSLAKYLKDYYLADKNYLRDIFLLKQYMYGHRKGEKTDRIYLVDVDPLVHRCSKEGLKDPSNLYFYHNLIAALPFSLSRAETLLDKEFEGARKELLGLLDVVCENEAGVEKPDKKNMGRGTNYDRIKDFRDDLKKGYLLYSYIK